MQLPTKRLHFGKLLFDIWENVYEPAEDTFFFAENINVPRGAKVLDIGTGSGILGIVAAENADNVLAIDLNPYAVRCAKANAKLNSLSDKMASMQASLFNALKAEARFDVILFNAPYLPSAKFEEQTWIERAWAGGANGRQVIDPFISQSVVHLKPGGKVLLLQSTLADAQETIRRFQHVGLRANIKAEQTLAFFETLTLIEARSVCSS